MASTVPSVPTKLVDVEVATTSRRNVPAVVLAATGPALGPGGDGIDVSDLTGKAGEAVRHDEAWTLGVVPDSLVAAFRGCPGHADTVDARPSGRPAASNSVRSAS